MATLFFDAIGALLSFNLQFFVGIAMNNLLWVFAFFAAVYYLMDRKHTIFYFIILVPYFWLFLDFVAATGIALFFLGFLLYIPLKLLLMEFSRNRPSLEKNFTSIWAITVYALLLAATFLR